MGKLEVKQEVNITNCEQEPIHIIGKSQAHGVLVVCNPETLLITQCSNNAEEYLGLNAAQLLNTPLSSLISETNLILIKNKLKTEKNLLPLEETINDRSYIVIPHLSDANLVIDIEPTGEDLDPILFQNQLTKILSEINSASSIAEMCAEAVSLVKHLFGYDRVMMYTFDEKWNGKVVAEVKEEHLESWLGLHYPARDIPKQAREIFLKQGARIIADVDFTPANLIPELSPITNKPLDISRSELRSVSPIHIEYLKNMKVGASLTAAIILNGKLWGLLACHHYSPKFINYHLRQSCKFLTQIFSNSLAVRTTNTYLEHFTASEEIRKKLVNKMSSIKNITNALSKFNPNFTDLIDCGGGALINRGEITLLGETPNKPEIIDLIKDYLSIKPAIYYHKNLTKKYPKAASFVNTGAGILSIRVNEEENSYIIWFRPQISKNVNWGGNPAKNGYVEDGVEYLSPRKSFEKWTEKVAGISSTWKAYDIDAAAALQESITHVIIKKQKNEIYKLNDQLLEANKELETFSYSVSHDLRAPLRGIDGYARILNDHYSDKLDDYSKNALSTIISSAELMDVLIEDILSYAKVGKDSLDIRVISIKKIIDDILISHNITQQYPNTTVVINPKLPKLNGDSRMISQLMNNLISNAIKYSSKKDDPKIEIGFLEENDNVTYFVKDNGIGFNEEHRDKIFDVFKRLVGDEFSGSGVGLAISKKVIEKHDGKIWVTSKEGVGTTFFFQIPDKD